MEYREEKVYIVTYKELERVINEQFPNMSCPYSVCAYEEVGNNTTLRKEVTGEGADDPEDMEEWASGNRLPFYMLQDIMETLAERGVIPVGVYNIEIWW